MQDQDTQFALVSPEDLSDDAILSSVERDGEGRPVLGGIPLLARVGAGGHGAVYYGLHPRLGNPVAVKVLPQGLAATAPEAVPRLVAEARAAARVQSSHLVRTLDVDEQAGLNFIVMEYVDGVSAKQHAAVSDGRRLAEHDALQIALATAKGLRDAHSSGVVHRDVKPDNILIPRASDGTLAFDGAKLTDLGIAKSGDAPGDFKTNTGVAMGTPGYMAPEQGIDAKAVTPSADVFSMGATLYSLLAGRAPFEGTSAMAVLMKTMHEPHESLKSVRPDVCGATLEVVDRCLAKNPDERFKNTDELIAALTEALTASVQHTDLWTEDGAAKQKRPAAWPWRVVEVFLVLACAAAAAGLFAYQAERRRGLRARIVRVGNHLGAGRYERALEEIDLARQEHAEDIAATMSLNELAEAAHAAMLRRAASGRAEAYMRSLVKGAYDESRALIDPEFVAEHDAKLPGMLRLWSLALRLRYEEADVRGGFARLGEGGVAWVSMEFCAGKVWKTGGLTRVRMTDGAWYVWPQWPPAK